MPPSGYSQNQADSIKDFLLSCAKALHEEALHNGESLTDALQREVSDIELYLRTSDIINTQIATLQLTSAFYQKLKDMRPRNSDDFWQLARQTAASVKNEILSVKIPVRVVETD